MTPAESAPPLVPIPPAHFQRVPRCRLLDEHLNRCGGPELGGSGLCAHHLAEAAADFRRLTTIHEEGSCHE